MSTPVLIISGIAILIVLVILMALLRRSRQVEHDDPGVIIDATPAPSPPPPPAPLPPPAISGPASVDGPEGNAVGDQIAAAMKDIAGEMTGVEAQPDMPGEDLASTPPERASAASEARDAIILIKGLGPKFVKRLNEIGIDSFAQIAAWSEADVERIEDEIGIMKGRIARDRWVEQAGFLTRGEKPGFEERFGKLN